MGIAVMSTFPTIEPSFQFHPHSPIVSYNAPPPDVTITISHPEGTPQPTSNIIAHGALSASSLRESFFTSTTAIEPTQSIDTASNMSAAPSQGANPLTSNEEGSKGPKIGVIVGIAIVAILVFIVAGFCVFDVRRRFKKRKETRRQRRDSELAEMSSRRSIKRNGGLWDKLKPTYIPEVDAERQQGSQTMQVRSESDRRSKDGGMWRSISVEGQTSKCCRAKDQSPTTERPPEPEWLPAYRPRERASIISTAGSLNTLGIPILNSPVLPRTFLDVGDRK